MHGTEEASKGGKVRVRIIHGLNISQNNSYTYCKKLEVIKNQRITTVGVGRIEPLLLRHALLLLLLLLVLLHHQHIAEVREELELISKVSLILLTMRLIPQHDLLFHLHLQLTKRSHLLFCRAATHHRSPFCGSLASRRTPPVPPVPPGFSRKRDFDFLERF